MAIENGVVSEKGLGALLVARRLARPCWPARARASARWLEGRDRLMGDSLLGVGRKLGAWSEVGPHRAAERKGALSMGRIPLAGMRFKRRLVGRSATDGDWKSSGVSGEGAARRGRLLRCA